MKVGKKINFPITSDSMTDVFNIGLGYLSVFDTVTELRILHNDSPAWTSDPIEATLDIDNIMARSTPFLGVDDYKVENKIKLYPNPSNGNIIFHNKENINENFLYKVFDLTGRQIISGKSKFDEQINIMDLTNGNYFIQIETENGEIFIEKFIKN